MNTRRGFVASILAGTAVGVLVGVNSDRGDAQQQPTDSTAIRVRKPGPGETHRVSVRSTTERPQAFNVTASYVATRRVVFEPGLSVSDKLLKAFGLVPIGKGLPPFMRMSIGGAARYLEPKDTLVLEWKPFE